jgi:hypothetical protein
MLHGTYSNTSGIASSPRADKDEHDKFQTYYFTYYVFDCNVSLTLAIVLIGHFIAAGIGNWRVDASLAIIAIIFVWNAKTLRTEIAVLTRKWGERAQPPGSS